MAANAQRSEDMSSRSVEPAREEYVSPEWEGGDDEREEKIVPKRRHAGFSLNYLEDVFHLTPEEASNAVAPGENPLGIDAWHFDSEKKNLYFFIFRWSSDPLSFKHSLRTMARAFDALFGTDDVELDALTATGSTGSLQKGALDPSSAQYIERLRSFLFQNRLVVGQVIVHLAFNGAPKEVVQSELLQALVEEMEGKKYLMDEYFQKTVGFSIEVRSRASDDVGILSRSRRTHRYQIDLQRPVTTETPSGEQLHVGMVRLTDLLAIYEKMGHRFFSRNIRSSLSSDKSTNKSIQKTIEDIVIHGKMDPEAFVMHHNGVSLAVEEFEAKRGAYVVTEPRLLNGAQTVSSLAAVMKKWGGRPEFLDNRDVLDRVRVLCKVISHADAQFVAGVTISNNRQNPVEPWNLRANDDVQLEYQEKIRRELGLYYERQEEAFQSLSAQDLEILGVSTLRPVEMRRLAQTILAFQGELDRMSRLKTVFEVDSLYRDTFRETYLKKDARRIILAYKIQFRLQAATKEVTEKYAERYHWLPKAKNLIWSLLVQALMNSPEAEEYAASYGVSLRLEGEFVDLLRDLTSRKIRPVLSHFAAEQKNAQLLAEGNFSFLRTKGAFQRCMAIAEEKHGWSKQSI